MSSFSLSIKVKIKLYKFGFPIDQSLGLGILIANLYSVNYWDTGEVSSIYPGINISNSFMYKKILLLNEISSSRYLERFNIKFGAEVPASNRLKVRAGYSKNQSTRAEFYGPVFRVLPTQRRQAYYLPIQLQQQDRLPFEQVLVHETRQNG